MKNGSASVPSPNVRSDAEPARGLGREAARELARRPGPCGPKQRPLPGLGPNKSLEEQIRELEERHNAAPSVPVAWRTPQEERGVLFDDGGPKDRRPNKPGVATYKVPNALSVTKPPRLASEQEVQRNKVVDWFLNET